MKLMCRKKTTYIVYGVIFVEHGFTINVKTSSPVKLMTPMLNGHAQTV